MKRLNVLLFVLTIAICFGACTMSNAELRTAEIKSGENDILNKNNLDVAKRFILKNGQTCTWSNIYNNNPCFATQHYQFYLNPDPGGPNNHPQWNINCNPKKGDFNTLVIRANEQQKETIKDVKIYIEAIDIVLNFMDKDKVEFSSFSSKVDNVAIIKSSETAVKELLIAVKSASRIRNKSDLNKSPLENIVLKSGMKRAEVDTALAKATGIASDYNAYTGANKHEEADLQAVYKYGLNLLTVQYNQGTPAPWVTPTNGGPGMHHPPVDQTLKSWQLTKLTKSAPS